MGVYWRRSCQYDDLWAGVADCALVRSLDSLDGDLEPETTNKNIQYHSKFLQYSTSNTVIVVMDMHFFLNLVKVRIWKINIIFYAYRYANHYCYCDICPREPKNIAYTFISSFWIKWVFHNRGQTIRVKNYYNHNRWLHWWIKMHLFIKIVQWKSFLFKNYNDYCYIKHNWK